MVNFLIGFMACGKTKWGKKMAEQLDWPIIDLDQLFEEHYEMTIPDFFAQYGESAFREKERDLLQTSIFPDNCIVSCGGGTPCFFDNMEWMNEHGNTIYIEVPAATLTDRILNAKTERPLAKGKSKDELFVFVYEKLGERRAYYEKAHHTISGLDISLEFLRSCIK